MFLNKLHFKPMFSMSVLFPFFKWSNIYKDRWKICHIRQVQVYLENLLGKMGKCDIHLNTDYALDSWNSCSKWSHISNTFYKFPLLGIVLKLKNVSYEKVFLPSHHFGADEQPWDFVHGNITFSGDCICSVVSSYDL